MDKSSWVDQDDLVVKWQDHISHNNSGSTFTPFPLSHATSLLRLSQLDFKLLISNLLKKRPLGLKVSECLYMTGSYATQKHRCVFVCSVMSKSLQPYGLEPGSFLYPWNFPGESTEDILLQHIFPTQGLNVCLPCLLHWQVNCLLLHRLGSQQRISQPQMSIVSRLRHPAP